MDNKKTPASSVVFYIIGIILLIVALFMLWTAVNYTKAYLQSYDASFKDMWSNSLQYIITQFVPYLGMGVICLGLGRAIEGSAAAKAARSADDDVPDFLPAAAKAAEPAEEQPAAEPVESRVAADQVEDLIRRIDANREVLSIKIEEKEKRDSVRLQKLEKKVEDFLNDVMYINEPLEELVNKQAGLAEEETAAAEDEAPAAGPTPQIFRVARNMTAPACPIVAAAPIVGATPQIFRVARNMTAPACPIIGAAETAAEAVEAPAAGPTPQIFRVARNMTAPACPIVSAAEAAEAEAPAVGPTPQIFRVARNMTMPSC